MPTNSAIAASYWLMKSEPDEVSIDDALAAPGATVAWTGVRNYQARNFMRDGMKVGDGVLFYHSSCPEPGIAGIARVASGVKPDPTQFDAKSPYYDAKSKPEDPRWLLVDVKALRKTRLLALPELREKPELAELVVLRKGNRLSITPVEPAHWKIIEKMLA
ncbi:Predicted RNA-binding protein, contains PUA-like domain [Variovorax sp. OK605]|jgi:predicted RNA-binding protein with PUA-like domain|uniref:EVE domain-containing protein n=1 Tax=Variovorax sp. OK605 TaxID=1855317 RepID=UPI0008E72C09|nr:EVE domain-containing protein [Variovorax sp. OK605]SFQ58003.1 Predicted RNA-binding protein, contains PUA-like domain [Variovorax sp. OK605]